MKTCIGCKQELEYKEFNRHRTRGYQSRCRQCDNEKNREWYQNNKQRTITRVKHNNKKYAKAGQEWICKYLETHPCVDCGESDIIVLQFDHIADDKAACVSEMIRARSIKVQQEIEKCEVVCANCHSRRTAARGRYYRWRYVNEPASVQI